MKTTLACAVWLLLLAADARAADPKLLADAQRDMQVAGAAWDERAVLAGLLARPAESAAFDADARASLSDPQLRPLFIAKWRGRAAAFAETEKSHPDIDYSRTYNNWAEIMSPEMRAYMAERMNSMSADDRNQLVYYLKKLNDDLASNHGRIDTGFLSISKRIVDGIMKKYREDLSSYSAAPLAMNGRTNAASSAAALAAAIAKKQAPPPPTTAAPDTPALPPSAVVTAPPKPVVKTPPPSLPPSPIPNGTAGGPGAAPGQERTALEQLRNAQHQGQDSGATFDGSGAQPGQGATVASGPGGPSAPSGLSPAGGGGDAAGPPAPGGDSAADFMKKMEAKGDATKHSAGKWPLILDILGGILGALLGGLIGALIGAAVGGPTGAVVGAIIGGGAGAGGGVAGGYFLGKKFF